MNQRWDAIRNKLEMLLTVCKITKINEDTALQETQFTQKDGELRDKRENYQPYGFAHYPHAGAEGISLSQNGDREHMVIICITDRNHRFKLEHTGECAIYDDQGQHVWIKRDGIEIHSDKKITIKAPEIIFKGDVNIEGNLNTTKTSRAGCFSGPHC